MRCAEERYKIANNIMRNGKSRKIVGTTSLTCNLPTNSRIPIRTERNVITSEINADHVLIFIFFNPTLWLACEGRTLARVRSKATCYVLFISVLRKRGQPFQPINPQRDVYNTASNGPIKIAVNTKFAPSAVAYSSCSSVCANSSLTFHFSCTDILQRA